MSRASDELRERFEVVQRKHRAASQIFAHLNQGELGKATVIAGVLGGPLPTGQLIDLRRVRDLRALHKPT